VASRKLSNITRFDYGRTRGWWVRIRRRGKRYAAFFSDAPSGGTRKALDLAIRQRNAWLDKLPELEPKSSRPCACGCGRRVKHRHPSGRLARFVPGHRAVAHKRSKKASRKKTATRRRTAR
jgi:hypothetical protein